MTSAERDGLAPLSPSASEISLGRRGSRKHSSTRAGQVPARLRLDDQAQISDELVARVREQIGPVASLKAARIVHTLPNTRSGKTLRKTIRKIADGECWRVPPTIKNPNALDEKSAELQTLGFAPNPPDDGDRGGA